MFATASVARPLLIPPTPVFPEKNNKKPTHLDYRTAAEAVDDDPGETHKLVPIWQLLFKSILLKLFLLKNKT